jgi:predicted nuclease of predicted toxin-antitoxin system
MNHKPIDKIIIDIGVGKIIEEWVSLQNLEVISIRKINHEMPDLDILNLANKEKALIITMDKDFGELVYKHFSFHHGVLLLRLEDAVAEEKLAVIQNIFSTYFSRLRNNFCVYQNGKFRIRK